MPEVCPHCQFDNPPGMRFCGNCGVQIASSPPLNGTRPTLPPLSNQSLIDRYRQASLDAAGQRRDVTVMFADLSGYTRLSELLDSEDLYEIIQQILAIMAKNVYRYDGTIDKYTGDGVQALFGAPITNENNAEMAIRAALDMQAEIREFSHRLKSFIGFDLDIHVGLHSGSVVVGSINENMMMDYTAVGNTVNLAHRLEEVAEAGAILVSEPVHKQTHPLFDFERLQVQSLVSSGQQLSVYRVKGHKAAPGRTRGVEGLTSPMIGRQVELQVLQQSLEDLVEKGEGGFIMIQGEAGIGKSRLVSEFKACIDPLRVNVLEAQNQTYQQSIAYGAFQDVFHRYIQVDRSRSEEEVRAALMLKLEEVLPMRAVDLAPLFEHLFGLSARRSPAAERLQYLEPAQLRQQIFLACRELLLAECRRQPILIIFEDLHWADRTSIELLQFLLSIVLDSSVLLVGISRPIHDRPIESLIHWSEGNLKQHFKLVPLELLSPEESERLLLELVSISDAPDSVRIQILERAAGVPFYLEEILRMLLDKGCLEREHGHYRVVGEVDFATLGVPDSIQNLILARFDKLDDIERRILQIAAVLGQPFSLPLLRAILSASEKNVTWDEFSLVMSFSMLMDREFLVPAPATQERSFTFRHVLMHEAVLSTLLKRDRSQLHQEIGEAIENLYADRLNEKLELLADHYLHSPRLDKALQYTILAGQKAAGEFANTEARQYFENALALLEHIDHTLTQALQIHSGLGDVLSLVGEYQDARRHYQDALALIPTDDELLWKDRSVLLRKIGSICIRQGEYDEALRYLAQAQDTLQNLEEPNLVEQAQALNEIGFVHMRRAGISEAEENLKQALTLLENISRFDVTASIYNRLGGIYFVTNDLTQARIYVQKSLALREELGDIVGMARSYNNLGLIEWKSGSWENALDNFTQSVHLNTNLGDIEGGIEVHGNLGLLHLDRGDISAAHKHLEQALASAVEIGHPYLIGIGYLYLSRLHLASKDWHFAIQASEQSLKVLEELGDKDHSVEGYTNLGLAYLGQGNLMEALDCGMKALRLSEASGENAPEENLARALRLLGKSENLQGNSSSARQLLLESAKLFSKGGNQLEQGRAALSLAEFHISQGAVTEARMMLNEARLIFRHLGAKLDLLDMHNLTEQVRF
jgi:predicted ATPase/class 3 adenylate cyclase